MRLLLQRTASARVEVEGRIVGEIGEGLLVLAGFGQGDGPDLPETKVWDLMLNKVLDLRIFPDAEGKFNLSLRQVEGELLAVSQFTLYAACRKGRRPSFSHAADPALAEALYDRLVLDLRRLHAGKIATGEFGAMMDVALVNRGPVTIMLDSEDFS